MCVKGRLPLFALQKNGLTFCKSILGTIATLQIVVQLYTHGYSAAPITVGVFSTDTHLSAVLTLKGKISQSRVAEQKPTHSALASGSEVTTCHVPNATEICAG